MTTLAFLALAAPAHATDAPLLIDAEPLTLAPAATGNGRLTLHLPAGYHLYKDNLEVLPAPTTGLAKVGQASLPPGITAPDPSNPGVTREGYEADVVVEIPVTAGTGVGTFAVPVDVTYQVCKASVCWMPRTDNVPLDVAVQTTAPAAAH